MHEEKLPAFRAKIPQSVWLSAGCARGARSKRRWWNGAHRYKRKCVVDTRRSSYGALNTICAMIIRFGH